MKPWVIWMIHYRMAWVVKLMVYALYPVHLAMYHSDVMDDIRYTIRMIKDENQS